MVTGIITEMSLIRVVKSIAKIAIIAKLRIAIAMKSQFRKQRNLTFERGAQFRKQNNRIFW